MEVINGYGYSDDLDRIEHLIETIAQMYMLFGISLEEAAGRFDRYAHRAIRFVKSEMFFHETPKELACMIYYGPDEWERLRQDPLLWLGPERREQQGLDPLMPQPYP